MRLRRFILALVVTLAGPGLLAAAGEGEKPRALIDSGHAGAVRWMEFDDKRGLLFTTGDDGTVRIWNPDRGALERVLQVTQLSTGRLAINPSAPQVAVVVTDGTSSNSLSVWDWEGQRQLFRVPLREAPLFLRFSAQGTYILYGESSWQGLKILHAADGSPVEFHPEGFGIVGFAEMSRSEKTLLTYRVSGRITYWDLATGQQTVDVPTIPFLTGIRISRDLRWLVGTTGSEITLIDAVTGAAHGKLPLAGARSLDISPAGDEIACIAGAPGQVLRWTVSADALNPVSGSPELPADSSRLVYGADALYVADPTAGLLAVPSAGQVSFFGRNVVAGITGFDADMESVALASRQWVRVLSSSLLSASHLPASLRTTIAANPFGGATGLALLGTQQLLAWQTDATPAGLAMLDVTGPVTPPDAAGLLFRRIPSPFQGPIVSLRAAVDELVGIEAGGTIRIVDTATGASRFEARIPGAAAAVRISSREILAGRNATAPRDGSLVRLNMATGETVAIKGRNVFTYTLLLDPAGAGPALYSVGIDPAGGTSLFRHDGPGFERETLLDRVPEEDLEVSLSMDPAQHILYATLGRDRMIAWDGMKVRTIALENAMPRRVVARDGLLFCLNEDSTVTVADGASGAWLAQIALLTDGEWCAVFREGRYIASTGGDARVRVFMDGAPVDAPEEYRLRTEIR